jgi:hypothetical protein
VGGVAGGVAELGGQLAGGRAGVFQRVGEVVGGVPGRGCVGSRRSSKRVGLSEACPVENSANWRSS